MQRKIDEFEMYRTACEFSDSADLCLNTENDSLCITPIVVNAAFACEIFLKLLLHIKYIRYRRTHDLKILFELLPEDLKDKVKYCCVKRYGQWLDCFNFEYLKNISNAFSDWRYNYEHDWLKSAMMKIELEFLIAFKDSLKEQFNDIFEVKY